MRCVHCRGVRLLLGAAFVLAAGAAGAQRPAVGLGDGPWTYETFEEGSRIRVSIVTGDLSHPWGMVFLPGATGGEGTMADALITEREGRVRLFEDGRLLPEPVADLTEVLELDQLFDIALHPDFERNRFVYFTYSKTGDPPDASADYYATTALARGRFEDGRLTDVEDVFVADAWSTLIGGDASRIVFAPDGSLFMNVSHRRAPEPPQDLGSHAGKVLRLTDEGEPAPGNPFADDPAALPEIYSYGHRTVMDLVFHPETGALWELENGPNGGDEANIIEAGVNYGWPVASYGRDYDGSRFAPPAQEGMRQPEIFWVPSPTVSSMLFYTGDRFPAWRGNLLVTAMTEGRVPRTGHLQRIVLNENGEIRRERLLTDLRQRMRHIAQGPDGLLYLLTDETDAVLLRVEPVEAAEAVSESGSLGTRTSEASASGAEAPPSFDALPDWSGVWAMNGPTVFDRATVQPPDGRAGTPGVREHPPYNEEWERKYRRNIELVAQGRFPDPQSTCGIPAGFPRILNLPDVLEFVVRPEQTWILAENGPNVMRIYTDGRGHPAPEDLFPTYMGDSVGHWEGDTLVFETIALLGEEGGTIIDRTGLVLSDQMRVTTRMRRVEEDVIEARMVIEDPEALTAPWPVTKQYRRLPDGTRVFDYACAQNNRNPITATGETLTLGPDGQPLDEAASGEGEEP